MRVPCSSRGVELALARPAIRAHPGARLLLQLNYTRPGLPTLNPQLLEAWKSEVKEKGHVNCPNDVSRGGLGVGCGDTGA